VSEGRLLPRPDADTRLYWSGAADGRLLLQYCADCGKPRFYPRLLCPYCHSDEARWEPAAGSGTIYSFSVVHRAPTPALAAAVPYVVALIELDEGIRMFANVTADPAQVRIGRRVTVTFRHETDEIAIPEFTLIEEATAS
jgi:uncharacterized OB-fold protein